MKAHLWGRLEFEQRTLSCFFVRDLNSIPPIFDPSKNEILLAEERESDRYLSTVYVAPKMPSRERRERERRKREMNVQPDKEAAREAAEEGGGSHLGRSPTPDELPSESPPSLPHRTINLQVGSTAQYYFQSTLFYSSEIWLDLLRSDVRDLLDAFVRRWETGLETATTEGDGKSGFEVFVEVWKELGWEWIVLLGAVEGEVRQAWGRSIVSVVVGSLLTLFLSIRRNH